MSLIRAVDGPDPRLQAAYDYAFNHVKACQELDRCVLTKAGDAEPPATSFSLSGRLYASKSGWILLSVPNAVIRGLFDAIDEPGIELPYHTDGSLNAHISVMRPAEIEGIGGVDAVSERGHTFHYTLGRLKTVEPAGWGEMSRVWFVEVYSPELQTLRKTYGLTPLPNDNKFQFHITVATRKKKILQNNDVRKAAALMSLDDLREEGRKAVRQEEERRGLLPGSLTAGDLLKDHIRKQEEHFNDIPKEDIEEYLSKYASDLSVDPDLIDEPEPEPDFELLEKSAAGLNGMGIPDRTDFGNVQKLNAGQLADWIIQHHMAQRAGPHYDIRFGTPETGLYSWATRKELPEPGKRIALYQQPVHAHAYGSYQGPLKGYGAGYVKQHEKGKILVTKVSPNAIHFTTAHKEHPERYALIRPAKWNKTWLLMNTTPTAPLPYQKIHFAKVPAEKIEQSLQSLAPGSSVQAKLDGASSLVKLMKDSVELVSYRKSKETGRPIVHTERFFGGRPHVQIPKHLVGTVLRGEMYGEKLDEGAREDSPQNHAGENATGTNPGATEANGGGRGVHTDADAVSRIQQTFKRAIPPYQLGGILNATIGNAIQKQKDQKVRLRNMIFDIQQYGNKPIDLSSTPYEERRKMMEEVLPHLPNNDRFHLSPEVKTPQEATELWHQIKSKGHPLTEEGIVVHPPTGKPFKSKLMEDSDVHVTGTFPGEGKYKGIGAGGFTYAIQPDGPTIGRVGTGLSDELRKELHQNPEKYVGRVARIRAQQQLPSGAYRVPSFISWHEDYPMAQTEGEAKALKKAEELQKAAELLKLSGQSYFGRALQAEPIVFDLKKPVVNQVLDHFRKVHSRGQTYINQAQNAQRLQNSMQDPNYVKGLSGAQFLLSLSGKHKGLEHPVDQTISQLF